MSGSASNTERLAAYQTFHRLIDSATADGRSKDAEDLALLYRTYNETYRVIQTCEAILEAARPLILTRMVVEDKRQLLEQIP